MATFAAEYGTGTSYTEPHYISVNLSVADSGYVVSDAAAFAQVVVASGLTNTQPIDEAPVVLGAQDAGKAGSGNTDFYNRILVEPSKISAGSVVTNQEHIVRVWNGYLSAHTLSSIGATGDDGLTLTPSETTPYAFAAIEEQAWTLTITPNGPPLIDATYTLSFDVGDWTLRVNGQRLFAWAFEPDWSRAITERLEWATDILTSYNGTEQRLSLRTEPRRAIEYQFGIANSSERRKFEAMLWSWGANTWLMPIWMEGERLEATLPAGTSSITLSRVSKDWTVGGNAIFRRSSFEFEIVEVESIVGSVVTFSRPTENDWGLGDVLYPAIPAMIEDSQPLRRFTGDTLFGVCRFRMLYDGGTPNYTPTTYLGLPVITSPSVWVQDLTAEYTRKMAQLDFRTGSIARDDEAQMPFVVLSHHWVADGKGSIDDLRGMLYERAGRYKMVWLPSFQEDIVPSAQISAGTSAIDVEFGYITQHLFGHVGRRDIRIETMSGTVYYRRINGSSELNAETERVQLNATMPVTLQPSDIRRISWMLPARLDSDAIEFSWRYDDWVEVSATWRSVRDDV